MFVRCLGVYASRHIIFHYRFVKINTRGGDHDERKPGFSSLKKFFISALVLKQNKNKN